MPAVVPVLNIIAHHGLTLKLAKNTWPLPGGAWLIRILTSIQKLPELIMSTASCWEG